MMASVHDVAAYILARHGAMSTMKLQKLCYYSQAWSLVWDQEPLFAERIEAWANGPVAPALYHYHAGRYEVDVWPWGDSNQLTADQRETADAVIGAYGKLTARQLSEMTHEERPWNEARGTLPPTVRSNAEITQESMADFYSSLVNREDTTDV
jgi:uncharacterized phage-associated protein